MRKEFFLISLIILVIGLIFRLHLTQQGNFLFNMDSARDYVEVREMVELRKLRLTGPSTSINGLFDGPFWYYLLAVGYIISGGNPYSGLIIQFLFWLIGGYFILKLVSLWNEWLVIPIGAVWIASNFLVLTNLYAFNPTPVTLLSPLFIYLLVAFLKSGKAIYGISTWILAGIFFNLEMNFGVFIPVIIFLSIIFTKKGKLFRQKAFWIGLMFFIGTLLPQLIFDFKHNFIMSKAILKHISENSDISLSFTDRFQTITASFYNTFVPTMLNSKTLALGVLLLSISMIKRLFSSSGKDLMLTVSLLYLCVAFIGYLIIPVGVNPWHLGGPMVASLIIIAFIVISLWRNSLLGKLISICVYITMTGFSISNIINYYLYDLYKSNPDPSLFKNEVAAIDYVYKYAGGKNFKVYTYLPSIYDYPYQYLFWWYGKSTYGYLPLDYAYAPKVPLYISSKDKFSIQEESIKLREDSNLVFLIKEPDRNFTRSGWEGGFINFKKVDYKQLGQLEVEVRKESDK